MSVYMCVYLPTAQTSICNIRVQFQENVHVSGHVEKHWWCLMAPPSFILSQLIQNLTSAFDLQETCDISETSVSFTTILRQTKNKKDKKEKLYMHGEALLSHYAFCYCQPQQQLVISQIRMRSE